MRTKSANSRPSRPSRLPTMGRMGEGEKVDASKAVHEPSNAKVAATKLTMRFLEALSPDGRDAIVWDSELRGFGVRVSPEGVCSFIVQYRNRSNRSRRLALGRFPALKPEAARKMAQQELAAVARGADPAEERRSKRHAPTVAALLDLYIREHVEKHNAAATRAAVKGLVRRFIAPAIGTRKVEDVSRNDVSRLHQSMSGTPRTANMALAFLSKAMSLAEVWGMRPDGSNPCRRVKRYPETTRERFLSSAELQAIGETLRAAQSGGLPWVISENLPPERARHCAAAENQRTAMSMTALNALLLLLFTGARLNEILTLEWKHVDFDEGTVALPERKGGVRRPHPVSGDVLAILGSLPRISGSPWVLPRDQDPTRHLTQSVMQNAWQRIRRHAGIEDVRLHDLRHTVGTYAGQTGANAFLLRDLLRHKNSSMTGRYVNRDHDPIRAVSDAVGTRIAAGLAGGALLRDGEPDARAPAVLGDQLDAGRLDGLTQGGLGTAPRRLRVVVPRKLKATHGRDADATDPGQLLRCDAEQRSRGADL